MEVRALRVGHGLKTLLPHGILLVMNREERDWHRGSVGEAALTQESECDLCRLLDDLIQLDADDGYHPWLHQVVVYCHTDLAPVLTMDHRHVTAVDRNVPIIAELEECVVQHSREPRAMLARGTKAPILNDGDMGVVIHVHLKYKHKNITNPKVIISEKNKYRNWNKVNSYKEKAKTGLFSYDFVPEVNTKKWATLLDFYPLLI
jgi:hypothetical protein